MSSKSEQVRVVNLPIQVRTANSDDILTQVFVYVNILNCFQLFILDSKYFQFYHLLLVLDFWLAENFHWRQTIEERLRDEKEEKILTLS